VKVNVFQSVQTLTFLICTTSHLFADLFPESMN